MAGALKNQTWSNILENVDEEAPSLEIRSAVEKVFVDAGYDTPLSAVGMTVDNIDMTECCRYDCGPSGPAAAFFRRTVWHIDGLREAEVAECAKNPIATSEQEVAPTMEVDDGQKALAAAISAANQDLVMKQLPQIVVQHRSTSKTLDQVHSKQKAKLMAGACGNVCGLVSLVLSIVALTSQTNPECRTEPVHWKDWYLGHIIAIAVGLFLAALALYAAKLTANDDVLRASVHMSKGKENEAQKDLEMGMKTKQRGMKLASNAACCLCCLCCFNFAWFIVGIVLVASSEAEECKSANTWFWILFIFGIAVQCLMGVFKPSQLS